MYINNKWDDYLQDEYSKPYFRQLEVDISKAYRDKLISPARVNIFKAFQLTDFDDVKCVILAQDPYPQPGVATGLAFSADREVPIPKSLRNIFKELYSDLGIAYPEHGDLTAWAEQGVLLLNSILTVEIGDPASHKKLGWETFTDTAIQKLSDNRENLVFLLWGKFAQSKRHLIDSDKHLILETSHPSPHSVGLGFRGCKHFSQVNEYLASKGKLPIDWNIS